MNEPASWQHPRQGQDGSGRNFSSSRRGYAGAPDEIFALSPNSLRHRCFRLRVEGMEMRG